MPSKTPKQARAMRAAAAGQSSIGIPKAVGQEFVKADRDRMRHRIKPKGRKLNKRKLPPV